MHRRFVAAAMASALSFAFAGSFSSAQPPAFPFKTASDKAPSGKMIHFSVRNDAKITLVLQAGDKQISIEPGKTLSVKLPEGSQLTSVSGTDKHPAGSVLTTVGAELQGNTLAVS